MSDDCDIEIAPAGYESINALKDKKLQREMSQAIDGLARNPEGQGKALVKPLEGLRSLPAIRNRHRIIFQVDDPRKKVSVLLVGRRRAGEESDIYEVAKKLLKTLMREEE